jgi:hypothetical protein
MREVEAKGSSNKAPSQQTNWVWWFICIIPAIREALVREWWLEDSHKQKHETLPEK